MGRGFCPVTFDRVATSRCSLALDSTVSRCAKAPIDSLIKSAILYMYIFFKRESQASKGNGEC
jgi:hypothetical protein